MPKDKPEQPDGGQAVPVDRELFPGRGQRISGINNAQRLDPDGAEACSALELFKAHHGVLESIVYLIDADLGEVDNDLMILLGRAERIAAELATRADPKLRVKDPGKDKRKP